MALLMEDRHGQLSRITTLALPKTQHREFVEDRRSVYDGNGLSKSWPCAEPTSFVCTQRVSDLSRHKDLNRFKANPDRLSAVTEVSRGAQDATATAWIEALARPKQPHRAYMPPRAPQSVVTSAAQNAVASGVLKGLAEPKKVCESALKDGCQWEWYEWESNVSEAAKKAQASERVEALAAPKQATSLYRPARSPFWRVNKDIPGYTASERLISLAGPRTHKSIHVEDRSCYVVKEATLNAQASERVIELAVQVPRKQRTRK